MSTNRQCSSYLVSSGIGIQFMLYGSTGPCTANKRAFAALGHYDSNTGVQALQALSRSMFERFGHYKGHKTDDDMVFMNTAWAENAALRFTRRGITYSKNSVFMLLGLVP